ncbi:MAG: 3-hydroxyacyl-CoA dehydrogenase NAD-binding domain-containing protein [Gammaproteobacteria bacterium]|jgi:3-hydroxyacyl-CoA dehydrogenase/enoyl-CoA hydratase/3-hydroxybutyryl-CoA epimerase|nr:3-hydroxyacyl-CoA dehydrogenase NAD-binding domain-containing protein [Gammaproteobacteria bacterium]
MKDSTTTRHWHLKRDIDGICRLIFDKDGASTNVLSGEVMLELNDRLAELESDLPKGLIVMSGKANGFIAGADISEFRNIDDEQHARELVAQGQSVIRRLAALKCPTVAAINGFALGGGLELAMACDYRVIVDNPKAVVGLPEVKLGLHPGFGGTVRAVDLAGPIQGLQLMLTGSMTRPAKARTLGLVDKVVDEDDLETEARKLLRKAPPVRKPGIRNRLLNLPPLRDFLAKKMAQQVSRKARPAHYPSPFAMIELWRQFGSADEATRWHEEAVSFARMLLTDASRNLVRVFFLQDRMKALGGKKKFTFRRVHVVGAGVMGGDIAAWCALRGLKVTLQDREMKYVEPALERAQKLFKKKIRDPLLRKAATERLVADVDGSGVDDADVIIEAIFENAEAKMALYADMEPRMKPGALLATNTSSIPLETLREGLLRPNGLIGLHFFNPVAMMPLVEVIHTREADAESIDLGLAFCKRIDKLPLPCLSGPGFLVNRVLGPYMMEALLAAEEGIPLAMIDKTALEFGMPMGPIELVDAVGVDVAYHVGQILGEAFGAPVPGNLKKMVDAKQLGKKTGKGFYEYKDGKPIKPAVGDAIMPEDLPDRLVLAMVNEAVACLREGVVSDADLVDAGVIFGTGFAPFRGGPISYARARGVKAIYERLAELEREHGPRFKADPGWNQPELWT